MENTEMYNSVLKSDYRLEYTHITHTFFMANA